MSKPLLIIVCIMAFIPALPAQAQQPTASSIDALVKSVITNNPERRFYMDQIRFAGAERDASDLPPDPEVSVEVGERQTADTLTGAPLGSGASYGFAVL